MSARVLTDLPPASAADHEAWRCLTSAGDAVSYYWAWLALQCAEVSGVRSAMLLLEAQDRSSLTPVAVWPVERADATRLGAVAERCLRTRAPQIDRTTLTDGRVLLAHPVDLNGEVGGVVVMEVAGRSDAELRSNLRGLYWGTGRVQGLLAQRKLKELDATLSRSMLALDLVLSVGEPSALDEVLICVAGELAQRLECRRVAIGIATRGRVRLQALSGAAWFDRRTEFVLNIEHAMEEAVEQECLVCWPPQAGCTATLAVAHRDLARDGGVYTAVLMSGGTAFGAVTCETDAARDESFVAALEAVTTLLAPSLGLRRELARGALGACATAAGRSIARLRDPHRPGFWVGSVVAAAAVLLLVYAHGEYRVAARSVVEGEVQRAIVAPFEGFVAGARIRAGQTVKAGDELASLDDRDLKLEQQKWAAEVEQVERKYRDALARHEPANARILSAQLDEAAAQRDLAEQKLLRARLLAPIDGVVVTGDLSQALGSPVEKGKLLFEVAPLDAFRVVLKVPETEIRAIRVGEEGEVVLSGLADRKLHFTVKNIGIATAEDGQNLFRVEAQLKERAPTLRPGMEGVGKILVGERRWLWIWTHNFWDWLGMKLWRWWP